MILIQNAHIKPIVGPELPNGCLLAEDGRITAVAPHIDAPEGCTVIDAGGRLLTPGCVEAHCHIGLDNECLRWEGMDYNEIVDPLTPQLRAIDSINPQDGVTEVTVYDRTQDAVVRYTGQRSAVIGALASFSFAKAEVMELVPEHTSRALNREFEDKLAMTVMRRIFSKLFLPAPITTAMALYRSVKYIREGLTALWHGELTVAVLDATAVTVSMVRGDFSTAGSVMFMLRLGEILEEWTHKKSVADLAGAMSLNVDKVWLQSGDTEVLVPIGDVQLGDRILVRTGSLIPLDGQVVSGEAMVNQASITG